MTERKSNPRALVIDDEPDIRELLSLPHGRMPVSSTHLTLPASAHG